MDSFVEQLCCDARGCLEQPLQQEDVGQRPCRRRSADWLRPCRRNGSAARITNPSHFIGGNQRRFSSPSRRRRFSWSGLLLMFGTPTRQSSCRGSSDRRDWLFRPAGSDFAALGLTPRDRPRMAARYVLSSLLRDQRTVPSGGHALGGRRFGSTVLPARRCFRRRAVTITPSPIRSQSLSSMIAQMDTDAERCGARVKVALRLTMPSCTSTATGSADLTRRKTG